MQTRHPWGRRTDRSGIERVGVFLENLLNRDWADRLAALVHLRFDCRSDR